MTNGSGLPELVKFQEHFREYKIVVYEGLSCDNIMFEGHVESNKRLNLLYDDVDSHYHVITNLTGAMAKSTSVRLATNVVEATWLTTEIRRVANA